MDEHGFTEEYYNQAWSEIANTISPLEQQRIEETIALIPEDCSSILDVGCGDGRVTNLLVSRYSKVVGLDSSEEALRSVKGEKILGNIYSLPFPDKSFDLVLCCEVLEHLPFKVYPRALEEMERVAAQYILVCVPNNQDLKRSSVTCPYCGCVFNPSRHVRSFNLEKLRGLFKRFNPQTIRVSVSVKVYPALLVKAAKLIKLVPDVSFPPTVCPQCGYSPRLSDGATTTVKRNFAVRVLKHLAKRAIPGKKRGQWLLGLWQRRQKSLQS